MHVNANSTRNKEGFYTGRCRSPLTSMPRDHIGALNICILSCFVIIIIGAYMSYILNVIDFNIVLLASSSQK